MKTTRTAEEYAFNLAHDRMLSEASGERLVDPAPAAARASAFAVARFGKMPATMSRSRAIEFMRLGWGVKNTESMREAFDRAIVSGEIKYTGRRSFSVNYDMGQGRSAGGSSIGSRPVAYDVLDVDSINVWAERRVARAAYL